jgi:hypothetical protein
MEKEVEDPKQFDEGLNSDDVSWGQLYMLGGISVKDADMERKKEQEQQEKSEVRLATVAMCVKILPNQKRVVLFSFVLEFSFGAPDCIYQWVSTNPSKRKLMKSSKQLSKRLTNEQ